ncbi:MAG: hypothetical protein KGZ58_11035 [Ignavibacteriales bacterium]|nr:hypothetical protein [Ignavibacteriales bacterium]
MTFYYLSRLFHFIGIGLLSSSLFGGWLIHNAYLREKNLQVQAQILRVLKPVGLLGPIGLGLMLITGITNIIGLGFASMSDTISMRWLMEKLTIFVIAGVNGIVFGIRSAKRGKLVASMVEGNAPADAQLQKDKFDKSAKIFFYVQAVLFVAILLRSVLKYQ